MDNPFIADAAEVVDVIPARPRLDAQRFFLTYPACGDNPEINTVSLGNFFHELPNFHWAEISREWHRNDEPHYHCVVVFRSRVQRHMGYFDFRGKHPNIRVIRNARLDLFRCRHYIRKGQEEEHSATHENGPCTYSFEPEPVGAVPTYVIPGQRLSWGEILDGAIDIDTFLHGIRTHYPRDYVLRYDQVLSFAQTHFNRPYDYVPAFETEAFRVPDELDDWVTNVLRQVRTPSPGFFFSHAKV